MAYRITDKCISCGACAENCPVECISQGEEIYVINPDLCIGCGTCARSLPSRSTSRGIKSYKKREFSLSFFV